MWVALRVPGLDLTLPATLAGEPLLTLGLHTEGPHSSPEALQTPPTPPPPPSVRQASPSGISPKRLLPLGPPWVGSPCPCCALASTQTGSHDIIPCLTTRCSPLHALTPWSPSSVQFSRSVVSDSLRPHESQHARPPCPSPTPGVHPDSRPSSR